MTKGCGRRRRRKADPSSSSSSSALLQNTTPGRQGKALNVQAAQEHWEHSASPRM